MIICAQISPLLSEIMKRQVEVFYLDSLSVVGLYNMEIEAVHASSGCQKDAGFLVKMSSHID